MEEDIENEVGRVIYRENPLQLLFENDDKIICLVRLQIKVYIWKVYCPVQNVNVK